MEYQVGEMEEIKGIEDDLANLARLAALQSYEDVRLLLARLIRKYRAIRPQLADRLDQSLKSTQIRSGTTSVIRRAQSHEQGGSAVGLPMDSESKLSLIRIFDDTAGIAPPLLAPATAFQLKTLIRERQERAKLEAHGIRPTRSAILVGAPGLGKTLSARWIAADLGKPLWVLDLSAVMSSLLGKTGANLRLVLDYAKANDAVLLLDEIDAIAKRRNDDSDVGELKRLVTVILQEVDHWPATSLLLAATNHPELVDPALWRRFDAVLEFEAPGAEQIEAAIQRFLGDDAEHWAPWIPSLAAKFAGQSLADVERAIASMRRRAVLEDMGPMALIYGTDEQAISELPHAQRVRIAKELAQSGGYSHHEIHRLTGVSRDTIRKHAGPSPRKGRGSK